MSVHDNPDNQIDGQLTIEQMFKPEERLIAVSRIFAKARKNMNLAEQKTFAYLLSQINFKEEVQTDVVYLDKKMLADIVGIADDPNHKSVDLYRAIKELPAHSYIETCNEDKEFFDSGVIITRVTMFKNRVRVKFEKEYMALFTGLAKDYITMWSGDIFQMQSKRSVQFYEYLRQITDTRQSINDVLLGVRAIKEMFDIPKDGKGSYMRANGHFDRQSFERYVVDPICEDLKKCRMINLVVQPDGKYYVKEKKGNRVEGYRFFWTFTSHPAVATAAETKELQDRIDKNPVILKVAKDIVDGTGKQKQKKKTGKQERPGRGVFNHGTERNNDFSSLETGLLQATITDQSDN